MDYKYIEQLLERYWECQTTLEEEDILRSFFAQADIPASLLPYAPLFQAEDEMAGEKLGDDFEERIKCLISQPTAKDENMRNAKLRPITLAQRLAPLYRAAAIVAVVLTIGMAAQQGFQQNTTDTDDMATPQLAVETDTTILFTDKPELSPQTEAVLSTSLSDTLNEWKNEILIP